MFAALLASCRGLLASSIAGVKPLGVGGALPNACSRCPGTSWGISPGIQGMAPVGAASRRAAFPPGFFKPLQIQTLRWDTLRPPLNSTYVIAARGLEQGLRFIYPAALCTKVRLIIYRLTYII